MSIVTLPSFGNSTGCVQRSFKYDLCNLPPTQSTASSSKKGSNWKIFEFPFSQLSPSLLQTLGHKDLISAANFLAFTIFMISISASLKVQWQIWDILQGVGSLGVEFTRKILAWYSTANKGWSMVNYHQYLAFDCPHLSCNYWDRWIFWEIFLLLFPRKSFEQSWICHIGI